MSTLTFAIYFLAEHPKVLAKLREEILAKFPDNEMPSYDDLRDLKYTRAVLNGALSSRRGGDPPHVTQKL